MDEVTPSPLSGKDDPAQAADEISQTLDNATSGVGDLADNLGKSIEDGVANVEQKLDSFLGGVDNFFNKF